MPRPVRLTPAGAAEPPTQEVSDLGQATNATPVSETGFEKLVRDGLQRVAELRAAGEMRRANKLERDLRGYQRAVDDHPAQAWRKTAAGDEERHLQAG